MDNGEEESIAGALAQRRSVPAGQSVGTRFGVGGDVRVRTRAGTDVTFFNVPTGSVLPIEFTRVWNTGTTASQMVGLI